MAADPSSDTASTGTRFQPWRPPAADPSVPHGATAAAGPDAWVPAAPAAPLDADPIPPEARKRHGHTLSWDILFYLDLGFIALNAVAAIVLSFLIQTGQLSPDVLGGSSGNIASDRTMLWLETSLTLAMFALIPLTWVFFTRHKPWEGTLRYLQMYAPLRSILPGIGIALGAVAVAIGFSAIVASLGWTEPSPAADRLVSTINWPLAIFISFVAGFGEEVFFRGILQKRLGMYGQAAIFGAMHLANGFLALLITGLIGLAFGYLVKRGHSLWVVITAHFVYDLILLGSVLLFPEMAGALGDDTEVIVRLVSW